MPGQCRFCAEQLSRTFVDLGVAPTSNSFLTPKKARQMEPFYPLHAYVCESCLLVQIEAFEKPETIFSDYLYFSSYSDTWVAHAKAYCDEVVDRFCLNECSKVVEIASNDGYLLKNFVARGIPVLGIEPAANVAKVAADAGIPTEVCFFNSQSAAKLAESYGRVDLLVANNVLAHVPDLNDFVEASRLMLAPAGVATFEVPHLLRLIQENQFDTIYHEHFSYFSLHTLLDIFVAHGLLIFDVHKLSTHGGSLRIFVQQQGGGNQQTSAVAQLIEEEQVAGMREIDYYASFQVSVNTVKRNLLQFLIDARIKGKQIVGYGAPAKGNTLLNYCGIRQDFLDYTVDRSPYKQGRLLPGSHIPIAVPEKIGETKPDYVLVLPWNLRSEISNQLSYIRDWGGKLVFPIPSFEVVE